MVFCLVFHDVFSLCIGFFEMVINLKFYGPVVVVATFLLFVVKVIPGTSRTSGSSLISLIVHIVIVASFLLWSSTPLTISFFLIS